MEIAAAHKKGFVQSDAAVADLWASFDTSAIDLLRSLGEDQKKLTSISDKYFALMLINLFEQWFAIESPRKTLEYLVIDFRDSGILTVGDKMLAPGIAGIAEVHPRVCPVDLDEYRIDIKIHKWLGGYVPSLLAHELLSQPVF